MRAGRSRIALAAVVAIALPLTAEIGYRGWSCAAGDPYSSARTIGCMSDLDRSMDVARRRPAADAVGGRVPSPYFGWDEISTQDGLRALTDYFQSPEAELEYDVLIVGGAGARRFAADGFDILARVLASRRRFAGRPIRSTVLARDGGKQPQQLNLVAYALALGWRPDLVINLDGATELIEGAANVEAGAHPFQPAVSIWGALDLSAGSDRETMDHLLVARRRQNEARAVFARVRTLKLHWSALLGRPILRNLERAAADVAKALQAHRSAIAAKPRPGVDGPAFTAPASRLSNWIADSWAHTSISLNAICRARGIDYVHVLEPAPKRPEAIVQRGYAALLEREEQLRARGVAFVDGSRLSAPRKLAREIALTLVGAE